MPNQRNTTRRRRPRRNRSVERESTGVAGRLLIMLAVVAAIVLGIAIFFRVNVVDVQGNVIYSTAQVKEAAGVEPGDNLLTVNRAAITGRIQARMPYVQDVSVGFVLPDTVVIEVQESQLACLIQADIGGQWYMNTDGRVLGSTMEGFRGQIVTLTGITLVAPKAGDMAVATEGQAESLTAALETVRQMEGTGLMDQITSIDAKHSYDLVLHCGDRLEVQLGGTERLDYKIQYLQVVLDGLEDYQTGIIDLTFDVEQVARFIPVVRETEEEEPEEASEEEDEEQEDEENTE